MEVVRVRRSMWRLEYRKRLAAQVRADRRALVESEEKAQIGDIRLQERQASQIARAVARYDTEPCIKQVVCFLEKATVVDCERLPRLG